MERTHICRRVYPGAKVRRGFRVTGIEIARCPPGDKPKELTRVDNIDDYSSGCPSHRGCFGHMCETSKNVLLPPHSLSMRSGDIQTQYYQASIAAFAGYRDHYIKQLQETNYGKYGHLRSILSTPVSGSARLVSTPHTDYDPFCVYISRNLARKVIFCYVRSSSSGVPESTYSERCLEEGDYVILERPPSLTIYNNQPLRVKFWDRDTLGIHPSVFDHFHGDFDGDETHIYPLGHPESIQEAKLWNVPLNPKLVQAREKVEEAGIRKNNELTGPGDIEFIRMTTLSANQIHTREDTLHIGDLTRNKTSFCDMLSETMHNPPGHKSFVKDAIKGVEDIMRQQLTQPVVGYSSRQSRLASMCTIRTPGNEVSVITRACPRPVYGPVPPTEGFPAMRMVMALNSVAQQTALDAHRVGSTVTKTMDLISNLLTGRGMNAKGEPCDTICIFSRDARSVVTKLLNPSWTHSTETRLIALVKDDCSLSGVAKWLKGAYSPLLLQQCPDSRRLSICKEGILFVLKYYGVSYEEEDLIDFAVCMAFNPSASVLPVTTVDGMLARNLGWIESLFISDYTKLPRFIGSYEQALTPTSAAMCANFQLLRRA